MLVKVALNFSNGECYNFEVNSLIELKTKGLFTKFLFNFFFNLEFQKLEM